MRDSCCAQSERQSEAAGSGGVALASARHSGLRGESVLLHLAAVGDEKGAGSLHRSAAAARFY